MAQWLETLAALSVDSDLIPRTGMQAHSGLYPQFQGFKVLTLHGCQEHTWCTELLAGKIPVNIKKLNKEIKIFKVLFYPVCPGDDFPIGQLS